MGSQGSKASPGGCTDWSKSSLGTGNAVPGSEYESVVWCNILCKYILKGLTLERNEHSQNWKQLKCQVFWARLVSFGQLGLISDPHIILQKSCKELNIHKWLENITVDSRYLELQGTLWNTSRYPYFVISDLRNWGKQLIEQPPLTEWICNLTLKLEIYWKYCGKRGEIAPKEQFLLFSTIFCCLLVDLCIKTGTRFSLRDKRLFEISEFEITSVDCTYIAPNFDTCVKVRWCQPHTMIIFSTWMSKYAECPSMALHCN